MLLFACWHANPFCSNHGSALFSTVHAVLIAPFTKEFVVFSSFLQYSCQYVLTKHCDVFVYCKTYCVYNSDCVHVTVRKSVLCSNFTAQNVP